MCGINVIRNLRGAAVSPADLKAMCSVIEHRGPDAGGYALFENESVGLSHVRLSIIDLESGHQPLHSEDGQVSVVFNGELYDFEQHRRDLITKGHRFRTQSDTEVLLHLYLEYGTDSFSRLNGEFAFVIWDGRTRQMIAVKDRFGVKPLFIHHTQAEVFFISEVKSLFALPRVSRAFESDYFIGPFMGGYTSKAHCFQQVLPVPPGHWVTVEKDHVHTPQPYWTPRFQTDHSMTLSEAIEGVRERFTQAVERRMVADVPVGTYLSGGLDSTLVCGLLSQRQSTGSRLKSFNIGFENTIYDESALARKIAEYYGVEFETIDCTSEMLAAAFEKTVWHVEIPLVNPNSIAKQLLSRLVRQSGYKVCLTGEGADEVFGGYPYFKQEVLWTMQSSADPAVQAQANRLLNRFYEMESRSEGFLWNRDITGREAIPEYLPRANFHYGRMRASEPFVNQVFTEAVRSSSSVATPLACFEKYFDVNQLRGLDPLSATKWMTYGQLSQYIIPALGDRVEMANSVECRTPFLDCELVDFVSGIPPDYFMNITELKEKNLLRQAFQEVLPPFMHSEHKHPFLSPSWYRLAKTRSGREIFSDLLSDQTVREVGIFRPSLVRLAKLIWHLWPKSSTRWRRIDILMGQICSIHLLHRKMLISPDAGRRDFPLVDRTVHR